MYHCLHYGRFFLEEEFVYASQTADNGSSEAIRSIKHCYSETFASKPMFWWSGSLIKVHFVPPGRFWRLLAAPGGPWWPRAGRGPWRPLGPYLAARGSPCWPLAAHGGALWPQVGASGPVPTPGGPCRPLAAPGGPWFPWRSIAAATFQQITK